ncbi:hypothetical protein F8S13_03655 [Chloroflexia bacterium SDU3-3]|nr:hypothetical protein F8S13_03655 [Chloroflexia bacterium SDU3-3]
MRRFLAITIVALALLATATPAWAHAGLVRSTPAVGSTLDQAPAEIVLEFSEQLDADFSRVQLFDSSNALLDAGPGSIDPADPHTLRLALGTLPKGTYTALWRARSAVDGHVTEGSVPFGVGVAVAQAALIPPPGAVEPATAAPPLGSAATRWMGLLALVAALGGVPFALLVWRPAFRAASAADQKADYTAIDQSFGRHLRRLIVAGSAAGLLAAVVFLIDQAATAAGVPAWQALGQPAAALLRSYTGGLLVARAALGLATLALATRLPAPGAGAAWPWWLALGLGGAQVLTFSLGSHAAAEPQGAALATALDWLHIAATVAWVGGLAPLGMALWGARERRDHALPLGRLIPRFSALAVACVLVLAASGTYSYFLHIGQPALLRDTTYGRALAAKLALFALLLALGAWNLLVLSPGLRKGGTGLARRFGRSIAGELALGALVLLAVGAMTSVAPSKAAWAEQSKLGISQTADLDGASIRLQVAPAQIGENEFAVDVRDTRQGADAAPATVLIDFTMVGMEMGTIQAEMKPGGDGRYTARGSYISMGGRWQIEVIVRRPGYDDIRHTFQADIVKAARP